MAKEFTVLATSGWQGDSWHLIAVCETRKAAEIARLAIQTANSRDTGYITAICGQAKPHPQMDHAYIVDTSRVHVREPHLRSRRCTVDAVSFIVEDGPYADLVAKARAALAEKAVMA